MTQSTDGIKKVLTLLLDGISVAVSAEADGKITLDDAALLIKLFPDLGPAVGALSSVPAELADLDDTEAADLVAFVETKLTLPNAHALEVATAGLKAVASVWHLIQALKK